MDRSQDLRDSACRGISTQLNSNSYFFLARFWSVGRVPPPGLAASRHLSVWVILATLVVFCSCSGWNSSRYLGFDERLVEGGFKPIEEKREMVGVPRADRLQIRFYDDGIIRVEIIGAQTYRIERTIPRRFERRFQSAQWDPFTDLFYKYALWPLGAIVGPAWAASTGQARYLALFPPVDLFWRLAGGYGVDGGPPREVGGYRSYPPRYGKRLQDWIAWIDPTYALGLGEKVSIEEEVEPLDSLVQIQTLEGSNTVFPHAEVEKVEFVFGRRVIDAKPAAGNSWSIDLSENLETMTQSDIVEGLAQATVGGRVVHKRIYTSARELGVTWDIPRRQFGGVSRIGSRLDLHDANRDGALSPGETARAILYVQNLGDRTLWNIETQWEMDPAVQEAYTIVPGPSPSLDRLNPGGLWTTWLDLKPIPGAELKVPMHVSVRFTDLSKTVRPPNTAELPLADSESKP